jgi:hypothetical protein
VTDPADTTPKPKKIFIARAADRRAGDDRRQEQLPFIGVDRRNGERRRLFHDRRDPG